MYPAAQYYKTDQYYFAGQLILIFLSLSCCLLQHYCLERRGDFCSDEICDVLGVALSQSHLTAVVGKSERWKKKKFKGGCAVTGLAIGPESCKVKSYVFSSESCLFVRWLRVFNDFYRK